MWWTINTTLTFTRTDGFHNIADGINMFKNRFFDVIFDSICYRRHLIAPKIRMFFNSYESTDFSNMFDIDHFNGYLYNHHGIFVVEKRCVNNYDSLREAKYKSKHCIAVDNHIENNNTISNNMYSSVPDSLSIRKNLTVHLRPCLRLKKFSRLLEGRMNQKYICLHMRTEEDFKIYQQNATPGYYTMKEIITKLRLTMRNFPSIFKNIGDIYIAGDHNNTEEIQKEFELLGLNTFTKKSISSRDIFTYMELALVDQEICENATVFIGNNHSAWSELVYYLRILLGRSRETNFQYNAQEPNEELNRTMHQFCTQRELEYFGRRCRYYRRL